jgi:hypothetical protein
VRLCLALALLLAPGVARADVGGNILIVLVPLLLAFGAAVLSPLALLPWALVARSRGERSSWLAGWALTGIVLSAASAIFCIADPSRNFTYVTPFAAAALLLDGVALWLNPSDQERWPES